MAVSRKNAASSDLLLNPELMNNKLHQVLSNALVFFHIKEDIHCTIEKLPKLEKNPKPKHWFILSCTNGCCRPALSTCQGPKLWGTKSWQRPLWKKSRERNDPGRKGKVTLSYHSWPRAGRSFVAQKLCAYGKKEVPSLEKLKVFDRLQWNDVGLACLLPVSFFLHFPWELRTQALSYFLP